MSDTNGNGQPNLVRLDERMAHVMRSIDDIRDTLSGLATRKEIAELVSKAEHAAFVVSFESRMTAVESRMKQVGWGGMLESIQRIAVTVSTLGAAGSLIYAILSGAFKR